MNDVNALYGAVDFTARVLRMMDARVNEIAHDEEGKFALVDFSYLGSSGKLLVKHGEVSVDVLRGGTVEVVWIGHIVNAVYAVLCYASPEDFWRFWNLLQDRMRQKIGDIRYHWPSLDVLNEALEEVCSEWDGNSDVDWLSYLARVLHAPALNWEIF